MDGITMAIVMWTALIPTARHALSFAMMDWITIRMG
jgi:hypothetical protein